MKNISKLYFWPTIIIAYFFTRLINFKIMPIFTDEAIYSYWAQIALNDPANRYISMVDGKQPLFVWLAAIMQRFVEDPLIASRLVSVFSGLVAVLGIYLLAKTLFGEKTGKIASILYIILPFPLLYDRIALYDSLLTAIGIYTFYFAIKIAKNLKLDLALINGVILGLGQITKSSANFFVVLLPISLLFFDFGEKGFLKRIFKWFYLTTLSAVISIVIYNMLRLSELFYIINQKNHEFIRTTSEVIADPLANFSGNLNSILSWFIDYNGLLFVILVSTTVLVGIFKLKKPVLALSFYIFVPLLFELMYNKVLYPRFSLFYFPYVIILASYGLDAISSIKKNYILPIILIILAYPIYSSFLLLTNPPKSNISISDKNQYLNDWPAGYGVAPIVDFLKKESQNDPVYVGTEGTFGLLPFAFNIYFYSNSNVKIEGYWPVGEIPQQVLDASKVQKTFFVFNENQNLSYDQNPRLKPLGKYQKGTGNTYMRFYEVIPEK